MKKIAVGDLGEFWYGDYKEPFVQLEGAVTGHPQGVLLKDDQGDLLCAFCGQTKVHLGAHVGVHGMTAKQYKDEVGLLYGSALVSERIRVGMSNRMRRRIAKGEIQPLSGRKNVWTSQDRAMLSAQRRAPETLNRSGRCYAQVLAVGRTIQREAGRLTTDRLRRHGVPPWAWRRYFDSVSDFAETIGANAAPRPKKWTDEQLLAALRSLAGKLGRTPSRSDLRRYGLPATSFRRRWGTYSAACTAAGLDANQPSPGSTSPFDQVAILNAYASTGSSDKAAEALGISSKAILGTLHRYGFPFPPFYKGPGRREWAADMAKRVAA